MHTPPLPQTDREESFTDRQA